MSSRVMCSDYDLLIRTINVRRHSRHPPLGCLGCQKSRNADRNFLQSGSFKRRPFQGGVLRPLEPTYPTQSFRYFFHQAKRETMTRIGIMGMLFALVLVTFASTPANAYHSRRGYHHHHSQHLSYRGTDACAFHNDWTASLQHEVSSFAAYGPRWGGQQNLRHGG